MTEKELIPGILYYDENRINVGDIILYLYDKKIINYEHHKSKIGFVFKTLYLYNTYNKFRESSGSLTSPPTTIKNIKEVGKSKYATSIIQCIFENYEA